MLTIRLQRAGKRNTAHFRLVLAEKARAVQKQVTEILGSYNPHTKELTIRDQDKLNYWIKEQRVEISPTAQNLLVSKGLLEAPKVKAFSVPKKAVEEKPEEAPAEAATEAAPGTASQPAEQATEQQEAPAEETSTEDTVTDSEQKPADEA